MHVGFSARQAGLSFCGVRGDTTKHQKIPCCGKRKLKSPKEYKNQSEHQNISNSKRKQVTLYAWRWLEALESHISLDQYHRRHVLEPTPEDVVHRRKNNNPAIHNHSPVHGLRRRGNSLRKERKDKKGRQIAQCTYVDSHTEATQGPPTRRQRKATKSSQKNAANADHVGRY